MGAPAITVPDDLVLAEGAHDSPDDGMCMLEAAAWIAGEAFSDSPDCVCPVIAAFGRAWNDALDHESRQRLLIPLLPELIGTATGEADSERRAWMALDWLARVQAPAWMSLTPDLREFAGRLRAAPEITGPNSDTLALLQEAQRASAAALAAASAAAWVAAWDAARDAARDAAWVAARDAASAAASAAAWDALQPTVTELQLSAVDLLKRMCAVSRETSGGAL